MHYTSYFADITESATKCVTELLNCFVKKPPIYSTRCCIQSYNNY